MVRMVQKKRRQELGDEPRVSLCLSLYRRLANAYPHEFRVLYGEDLERLGEDAVPEAWRRYGLFGW